MTTTERYLEIRYRRNDTKYSGDFISETVAAKHVTGFLNWEFRQIIGHASNWLNKFDISDLRFTRTDTTAPTYRMESEMVELIKVDPVEAIRRLTPKDIVIDLRSEEKKRRQAQAATEPTISRDTDPQELSTSPLRVGHATLAAAFGDYVYVRRDKGKIECIGCGRWAPVLDANATQAWARCPTCGDYTLDAAGASWCRALTRLLISGTAQRYFIPRAWNVAGPWITKEQLELQYNEYLKEKSNV